MATSWSNERIEQLISLLEDRPCLYNTKIRTYFNRDLRKKAHEEIVEAMCLPDTATAMTIADAATILIRRDFPMTNGLFESI